MLCGMKATPVIQSPSDMAALLRRSCPNDAVLFARHTFRRAADAEDETWAEFWHGVVNILSTERHAEPRA